MGRKLRALGWEKGIEFGEGLRRAVEWYGCERGYVVGWGVGRRRLFTLKLRRVELA